MSRKFRVWRSRTSPVQLWQWECSFCHPPARGGRFGRNAQEKIIRVSLPRHMFVRHQHHQWVARTCG